MMRCRVCFENEAAPLFKDLEGGEWYRCLCCGSDTSDWPYSARLYDDQYVSHNLVTNDGMAGCIEQVRSNAEWFGHYKVKVRKYDFLDVGHLEGSMLTAMADSGWSVHGFDVIPAAYLGPHTTIAPQFRASVLPQQYDAVNCREVIEHVPDWRRMLQELHAVIAPGGLLQLQTPRPSVNPDHTPYQKYHLQIFAPSMIRYWLERLGFEVHDYRFWDLGQAWMCQKVAG